MPTLRRRPHVPGPTVRADGRDQRRAPRSPRRAPLHSAVDPGAPRHPPPRVPLPGGGIDDGCQPDALHFLDHAIVVDAGVQPCSPHASRRGRVGTEHVHGIQRSDDRQPPQQCRGFPADHGIRMPEEMRVDAREITVPPGEAPPGGAVDVHAAGDGFHVSPPHAAGRVGQCCGGDQGQGRGAQGPKHGPRLWHPVTASALFHSSGFGTGRMGRRGRHCPRPPKPHPADIPDAQR